jgi:hypothetical protein
MLNAQCSRVIIIVIHVGTVEIHVAIVEVFGEKGNKGSFHPLFLLSMVLVK